MNEKKLNKFKNSLAIKRFPFIIAACLIVLVCAILIVYNNYEEAFVIEIDGYMIGNTNIESLKDEEIKETDKKLKTVKLKNQDIIQKNAFNHYIDNKKKSAVNVDYPLYVNDGLTIINYNDNINLIDKDFNRTTGYKNLVISYGKLYDDTTYSQIDKESYLLLQYQNGIYINLYDIKIKTLTDTYEIPTNSFIFFFENKINYYERTAKGFEKKVIYGIDLYSIATFYYDGTEELYEYTYEDLITKTNSIYIEEEIPDFDDIEVPSEEDDDNDKVIVPDKNFDKNWQRPEVDVEDFVGKVYSAESKLTIKDPSGAIVKPPTFTIYANNKVYTRRTFYSSGDIVITGLSSETEYKIVGQYTYLAEDKVSRRVVTFYNGTVTTLDRSKLQPIDLSFELGEIYSKKVELKNVKITSSLQSEAVEGIKNFAIKINGELYNINKDKLQDLLNGKSIDFATKEVLNSNTLVEFELIALDKDKNELVTTNNKGTTRTHKQEPSLHLKETSNDTINIRVNIDERNEDEVELVNYHYTLTDVSGKVIQSGPVTDDNLLLSDLDPNQLFYLKVYADIDLNDGKGIQENYLLGELEVVSQSISSLGFVNLKVESSEITDSSFVISSFINKGKTNKILMEVIDSITLNVYDKETDELVFTEIVDGNALINMKNDVKHDIAVTGLNSNTEYRLEFKSKATQGSTEFVSDCIINLDLVETRKKPARVFVSNQFVTQNMIDFDCFVVDTDYSVISNEIVIELRDAKNNIIDSRIVKTNQEKNERVTFNYLNAFQNYTLIFYANEYNETNIASEYKTKYELLRLTVYTQEGISGSIQLVSSLRNSNGTNIIDVQSENKWIQNVTYYTVPKEVDSDGTLHLYTKGGAGTYAYDLSDYEGKLVTVSFKMKTVFKDTDYKIYFTNYLSGYPSQHYGAELTGLNTENWTSYSFTYVVSNYNAEPSATDYINYTNYTSTLQGKDYTSCAAFHFANGNSTLDEFLVKELQIIVHDEEPYQNEDFVIERGSYNGTTGAKGSSNDPAYARVATDIYLKAGNYYRFDYNTYYASAVIFDANTNKRITTWYSKISGWVIKPNKDMIVKLYFTQISTNVQVNPNDVLFELTTINPTVSKKYQPYSYELETKVKVNITDLRNEITNDDYYIKLYENEKEVNSYNYVELQESGKIVDAIKKIDLYENKTYKVELGIKVRDRYYVLSSFDITTIGEVSGISNIKDWYYIQPKGNYIVLDNIDFKNGPQNTGWGYKYFYGTIDFQGYTMTLYTESGASAVRFYRMEKSAVLKNIVIDFHFNNELPMNGVRSFVQYNYGTISNIKLNIYNERPDIFEDLYFTPIVYNNYVTGVIENFVVNIVDEINLYHYDTALVGTNYGIIRNGYFYGADVYVGPKYSNNTPYIGLLQYTGGVKSLVENVYALNNFTFPEESQVQTGIITRQTSGTMRNIYTVGSSNENIISVGPIVGSVGTSATLNKMYYLNNRFYSSKYLQKITEIALNDVSFQKSVLGDNFDVEAMIKLGYYPHVKYTSEKMPKQDYILLPEPLEDNLVDIISMEIESQTNSEAIINFNVNNPQGDEITEIEIADVSVEILEQSYDEGKSIVKARLYNPTIYTSNYSIRSISSKNFLGYRNKRSYIDGEKLAEVEFFIEIYSVEDWLKIKNGLSQNYSIQNNLNFESYVNYTISNFIGKIEGNGYTLENIDLQKSGVTGLFSAMHGILQNINILNFKLLGNGSYAGLVGYSNSNGRYHNIHMKNVEISANPSKTTDTFWAGALVGYINGGRIENCSVDNVKIDSHIKVNNVSVGGLVGYTTYIDISNSYAQDVDINVSKSIYANGVGGLIGCTETADSIISHSYTTGKIYNDNSRTGGIIGYTNGYVENNISTVDIESKLNYVGGIIGYTPNTNSDKFINNIYLGNIYGISPLAKIIGNVSSNELNYSYVDSLVNGTKEETNGEINLTYEQLTTDASIFEEKTELSNGFDYSQIQDNILPKVYFKGTKELLPNQKDNELYKKEKLEITNLDIEKHPDFAIASIYLDNPNNYEITNVTVEGAKVEIIRTAKENNITLLTVELTPIKFYDIYKLSSISYKENEDIIKLDKKYQIQMRFYKTIAKVSDWNNINSEDPENYRLTADIDFTGLTNYQKNVIVNRLEVSNVNEKYKIKGAKIEINKKAVGVGLIEKVIAEMSGIIFEDFTFTDTTTSTENNKGLIVFNYGVIKDVIFRNININTPYEDYVGIIARNYGAEISKIEMENITINGRERIGGLVGYTINPEDIIFDNVVAKKINISGKSYVGGIIGIQATTGHSYKNIFTNLHIVRSDPESTEMESSIVGTGSYIGGLVGYGGPNSSSIEATHVSGLTYIGGISGYHTVEIMENNKVYDCRIDGDSYYIGGVAGYGRGMNNVFVESTEVKSNKTTTYAVGGISGTKEAWIWDGCGVTNVKVYGYGIEHGGFAGRHNGGTIRSSYIQDSNISGVKMVGTVAGRHAAGTIAYNSITRTNVSSENEYAGGISGFIYNQPSTTPAIYYNIVSKINVNSRSGAGGITGGARYPLYTHSNIYGHYLDVNVLAEDINVGIGTGDEYNNRFANSYKSGFYEGTTVGDKKLKDITTTSLGARNIFATTLLKRGYILSSGAENAHPSYPNGAVTDFIPLEAGKSYEINVDVKTGNDWMRVGIYDTDKDSSTNTYPYIQELQLGHNNERIIYNGYQGGVSKYVFTVTKDCLIRVSFYDMDKISSYTLKEINFSESQLMEDDIISATELRSKLTWGFNRYTHTNNYDYYYSRPMQFSESYFDKEKINFEIPTMTIYDKTANKTPATAKVSEITDTGVFFNGVDNVNITMANPLKDGDTAFTITSTVRRDSTSDGSGAKYIFTNADYSQATNGCGLYLSGRQVVLVINRSAYSTGYYISRYRETELTYTYDGSMLRLYANGEQVYTKTYSTKTNFIAANAKISPSPSEASGIGVFEGEISNLKVYNRALTASEIKTNYQQKLISDESGLVMYYDFSELENLTDGYYPTVISYNQEKLVPENQIPTPLPKGESSPFEIAESSKIKVVKEQIPNIHKIYSSSINTVNIEFDQVYDDVTFSYKNGPYQSELIKVDKKVYSLTYDYQNNLELTINTRNDQQVIKYTNEELRRTIKLINGKYYHLEKDDLYENGKLILKDIVHIYNELALTKDNQLFNLKTKELTNNNHSTGILPSAIPLYTETVDNNLVNTYYNFTDVYGNDSYVERTGQIVYKDGNLFLFKNNSNTKQDMNIFNKYNETLYQITLTNSKLVSSQNNLKYPMYFHNEDIIEISQDINSDKPVMLIKYDNGYVYAFDYSEGEELFSYGEKPKSSLFKFVFNNFNKETNLSSNKTYKSSKKLIKNIENVTNKDIKDKLNNTTESSKDDTIIDNDEIEIGDNQGNSSNSNKNQNKVSNNYIQVYNYDKGEYEVYSTNDILNTDQSTLESENATIRNNPFLYSYFYGDKSFDLTTSKLFIYLGIFIIIVINLGLLIKFISSKEVKKNA